jgi:hypothetical protein
MVHLVVGIVMDYRGHHLFIMPIDKMYNKTFVLASKNVLAFLLQKVLLEITTIEFIIKYFNI